MSLWFLATLAACGSGAPALDAALSDAASPDGTAIVAKGARLLSLDVRADASGDYGAALAAAQGIGVEEVTFALDWATVETAPGVFDLHNVDLANTYYPAHGVRLAMSIRPAATTYRSLPADLAALPLDDPQVITRFDALLDTIAAHMGDVQLSGIYLGSEHDILFGGDPAEWDRWERFWDAVRPHAKALWPTVPIGTELTYAGLTGASADLAARSNADADVVAVSYYPLGDGFQVEPPASVAAAFDAIAARYPGRTVHYNQLGYPSSATTGSSAELQRQFIAEVFRAWDAHASTVAIVNIDWQTDLSPAEVAAFEELYGITDPAFGEFLRTLGLRANDGTTKPAWAELAARADDRGW